jgi:hypothetical protein
MRAYPYSEHRRTVEISNHQYVLKQLMNKFKLTDYQIVRYEDEDWIEVNESQDAYEFIQQCMKAEEQYPVLNEMHYAELEWAGIVDAMRSRAKSLGTIIVSIEDFHDALIDHSIEIIEDTPQKYIVLCGDDTFLKILNGDEEE